MIKEIISHVRKRPSGTDDIVNINDVIMSKRMFKSVPAQWKMERARTYYEKHKHVDKPIIIKQIIHKKTGEIKYLLLDNYTRYLVLRENGTTNIPIKYEDITL